MFEKLTELSFKNTLFGIRFVHSFTSLFVFDKVFDQFSFENVVEFGTYEGGLSSFLWLECLVRRKRFLTIDVVDCRKFFLFDFLQGDLLNDSFTVNFILEFIGRAPTFLYCDNGDKVEEIRHYAKVLPVGSILGVHDWGTEVRTDELLFLYDLHFEPISVINKMCFELKTSQFFWGRGLRESNVCRA